MHLIPPENCRERPAFTSCEAFKVTWPPGTKIKHEYWVVLRGQRKMIEVVSKHKSLNAARRSACRAVREKRITLNMPSYRVEVVAVEVCYRERKKPTHTQ